MDSLFGKVVDVKFLGTDRLLTLDGRMGQLRVYSSDGRLLTSVGRPGPGPAEFSEPLALGVIDRSVLVGSLDRTVKVFADDDSRLSLTRVLRVDGAPRSLCAIGQRLYVNGPNLDQPSIVTVYDLRDGHQLQAFPPAYHSPNRLINLQLNSAKLACHAESNTIVAALSGGIGEIRSFDSTGRVRWITRLTKFRPGIIAETAAGYSVDIPAAGVDRVLSVVVLPSTRLLVQIAFLSKEAAIAQAQFSNVTSIVLDLHSGKQLGSLTLPVVSAVNDGSTGAGYYDEPFPHVQLWRSLPW